MDFHFDEGPTAVSFDDRSVTNLAARCSGGTCPDRHTLGLRGTPLDNNARLAVDFDGANDCLTIPHHTDHTLRSSTGGRVPFTMSAWIFPRSLPDINNGAAILSKYSATGNQRGWIFGLRNRGGVTRLAFWKSTDGRAATTIAPESVRTFGNADLDTWMHVVIRVNSSGTYQYWINGDMDSEGSLGTTAFHASTATTRIGCVASSTTSPDMLFRGKIDEVVVARSYASVTAIANLEDWSAPKAPRMAYVGTSSQVRQPDGIQLDPVALRDRLSALNAESYRFVLRRLAQCRPVGCADFAALEELLALPADPDQGAATMITLDFSPFWGTPREDGMSGECAAIVQPHRRWACAIGELAAAYPDRIAGWNIDDFFADHWGQGLRCVGTNCYVPVTQGTGERAGEGTNSFLNRRRLLEVCEELHRHAPTLTVSGTIYCNNEAANPGNDYDLGWLERCPAGAEGCTWDRAIVDYVKSTDDLTADEVATLRTCFTGVTLYTPQARLDPPVEADGTEPPDGADVINACIGNLRELQVEEAGFPTVHIDEGVYVSGSAGEDGALDATCANGLRQYHVDESRKTLPDGFVMYTMLEPDDCADPRYSSARIDELVSSPPAEVYTDW